MSRSTVAAAGVLGGLVLGVLIGFLLFADLSAGKGGPREGEPEPVLPFTPETVSRAPGASTSEHPPAPIRTRGYEESADRILDSVVVEESAPGEGVITGTVTTVDDQPLAGVVIRAHRRRQDGRSASRRRRGDPAPADPDIRTRVLELLQREQQEQRDRREAVSDAEGRYELAGLSEDPYSLRAYLDGYEVKASRTPGAYRVTAGETVDFRAQRVSSVSVDVRLPDGSQPPNATIVCQKGSVGQHEFWLPGAREIHLAPGAYSLRAESKGGRYRSEPTQLVLAAGEESSPTILLELRARCGIEGRVIFPRGVEPDNISVYVLPYAGTTPPDEDRVRRDGERTWASPHDDYRFRLLELQPGTHVLAAGRDRVEQMLTVEVPEGVIVEQDIVLPEPKLEEGLIVRVEGPDGGILKTAKVTVGHPFGWTSRTGGVQRLPEGTFLVTLGPPRSDLPSSLAGEPTVLTVTAPGYGEKVVLHPGEGTPELRVRLEEPASLEVHVAGYAGSALEGRLRVKLTAAALGARQRAWFTRFGDEGRLGAEGRASFAPIQCDTYVVQVVHGGRRSQQAPLAEARVTVGPGQNEVTVTLPTLHALTVAFEDGYAGRRAQLEPKSARKIGYWGPSGTVGENGEVVFEGLKAGAYLLVVRGPSGNERMPVTIPATRRLRFEVATVAALRVNSDDPSGTLASLGLLPGDLITGIGDADFDPSRPADRVLQGLLMAKDRLTLRILRNGKPLRLTVDAGKLRDATRSRDVLQPQFR